MGSVWSSDPYDTGQSYAYHAYDGVYFETRKTTTRPIRCIMDYDFFMINMLQ